LVTHLRRSPRDKTSERRWRRSNGIRNPSEDTMSYKVIDNRFANANVQASVQPFAVVAIDRLGFHKIITSFRTRQAAVRACIYLSRKAA